jgi:hypothetical protein
LRQYCAGDLRRFSTLVDIHADTGDRVMRVHWSDKLVAGALYKIPCEWSSNHVGVSIYEAIFSACYELLVN